MQYPEYLKTLRSCPFCSDSLRNQIIEERPLAYLTYAIAPYASHHLLVIPTRHVEEVLDLKTDEFGDILELLRMGAQALESKGINDYTMLVRNGKNTGKSVKHLHFHIVPKHRIGDLDKKGDVRKLLTERQIQKLVGEMQGIIKRKKK